MRVPFETQKESQNIFGYSPNSNKMKSDQV